MPKNKKELSKYQDKIYIGVIAITLFILCFYEHRFIIPSFILLAMIIAFSYFLNSKKELKDHEKTGESSNEADKSITQIPIPIIIMDASRKNDFKE